MQKSKGQTSRSNGDDRLSLFFGVPAYRAAVNALHIAAAHNFGAAVVLDGRFSYKGFASPDSSGIDHSRNLLVWHGLKTGADWLLMQDADTYHIDPVPVLQMLIDGSAQDAAVVAAPVKMRNREGWNVQRHGKWITLEDMQHRLVAVDRIGTAFMAINLRWLCQNWPHTPWFQTRQMPGGSPTKIGEDLTFCDAVRSRGGVVLCDSRYEPTHHGAQVEINEAVL